MSGSVRQPCGARDGLPTVQGDATTFISARVRTGFLDATRRASAATARGRPESLCLGVRPGFRASDAPPVHIYVGSEPAQLRALRVLLWSIERTRDPRRVYHVHVMSDLDGFDRRGWTTGFTNYRFAIPEFANGCGRAIYCEASQVFLADPGGLFDLDLHDALGRAHGYLAISDADPSVMLIDCASMARWWTRDTARRRSKKTALKRTLRQPFVRGALDARWNARDEEYVAGVSKLLNYATLHRQPWRPFPERFAYRPHRESALWHELERDAIAAGFTGFGASAPTRAFLALHGQRGAGLKAVSVPGSPVDHQLREIVGAAGVESVLELASERPRDPAVIGRSWGAKRERVEGLLGFLSGRTLYRAVDGAADAVVCTADLDALPAEDVPWVLDALFRHARRLVVGVARCRDGRRRRRPVRDRNRGAWWVAQFEAAAARHPDVRWHVALVRAEDPPQSGAWLRRGGPFPAEQTPRVWVLTDDRPGNTTQSLGLAEAFGFGFEQIDVAFGPGIYLPNPLLGASALGLTRAARRKLGPPWPDLVIGAGRRTAPVTRWIGEQSRGRTRTVQLGRKGANPAHAFDVAISPVHCGLAPHPDRVETAGALTRVNASQLESASVVWRALFDGAPRPRVVLLAGGRSDDYDLTPDVARRMGREVAAMAARAEGSLYVTTSRRTGAAASDALEAAVGQVAHFHRFRAGQSESENPYLAYLALADVLVVTSESESMLAEAIASGRPVQLYDLPVRRASPPIRAAKAVIDFIVACAAAAPPTHRGTTRPQRGLYLLCARLVERGWVRPNRDLTRLHDSMIERGLAKRFDGSLCERESPRVSETELVAERLRAALGMREAGDGDGLDAGLPALGAMAVKGRG